MKPSRRGKSDAKALEGGWRLCVQVIAGRTTNPPYNDLHVQTQTAPGGR